MGIELADLFHTGYVVADMDEAIADLSKSLGIEFSSVVPLNMDLKRGDGSTETIPTAFTYSKEGPHHVELLQAVAGSLYDTGPSIYMHHLGYWARTFTEDLEALVAAGCTMDAWPNRDGQAVASMAYLLTPNGLRVELVDTMHRPMLEALWRGDS